MTFRKDIIPLTEKNIKNLSKEEWEKICPAYGDGYKNLSGLYCDYCRYLVNENKEYCPNNK